MAKYEKLNLGQIEALVNILGGMEVVKKILRGTKKPLPPDKGFRSLFDNYGRRVAPPTMSDKGGADPEVCLAQPAMHLPPGPGTRFKGLCERLGWQNQMTPEEFRARVDKAVEKINFGSIREEVRGILGGVYLPFGLPQVTSSDCGEILDELGLINAVERVFKERFPEGQFFGQEKSLKGGFRLIEGSRHERFLEALTKEPVVAIYFPLALQGYLPDKAVEQMESLPEEFLLSGVVDTAAAIMMYPEVLLRDTCVPQLGCSAVKRWVTGVSSFDVSDGSDKITLAFGGCQIFGRGKFTSGLTVIA